MLLNKLSSWLSNYRLLNKSSLFDSKCYQENVKQLKWVARVSPEAHFLLFGSPHSSPDSEFDPEWYLANYPDVSRAGINPFLHYIKYGRAEGRQPSDNKSKLFEAGLWAGAADIAVIRLEREIVVKYDNNTSKSYAYWALLRWWSAQQNYRTAYQYSVALNKLKTRFPVHNGPLIAHADLAIKLHHIDEAEKALCSLKDKSLTDYYFLKVNLELRKGALGCARRYLNSFYTQKGLSVLSFTDNSKWFLDSICSWTGKSFSETASSEPLVSVVMPVLNAAGTISQAISSIIAQSYQNIEIIVVDDGSTDETVIVVKRFIEKLNNQKQPRILLIENNQNRGAYCSRNIGMDAAQGDFLTVHDSDDISHPDKIKIQLAAFNNEGVIGTYSCWIRCTSGFELRVWRYDETLVHPNISSLMIRRSTLQDIGYWDEVKASADTEYFERIITKWGTKALVCVEPSIPLAFGRVHDNSLTQTGDTHYFSQYCGVRKNYLDCAREWHQWASKNGSLYVARGERKFQAPNLFLNIAVASNSIEVETIKISIINSGYWEQAWYLRQYPEVQFYGDEPIQHYINHGMREGFEISPRISVTAHARYLGFQLHSATSSDLIEFFKSIQSLYRPESVKVEGAVSYDASLPTILLVGHQAGPMLMGAERSLVDLARAYSVNAVNLVIVLPTAINTQYIDELTSLSSEVRIIPDGWWQKGKRECELTIDEYSRALKEYSVDFVHLNSTVIDNALYAANRMKVPCVFHCREMLVNDVEMQNVLAVDIEDWYRRLESANAVITISEYMEKSLEGKVGCKSYILPNQINEQILSNIPKAQSEIPQPFRVGMFSSNIKKKGIIELGAIASLWSDTSNIEFYCFGPETSHLQEVLAMKLPNFFYKGYVEQPLDEMRNLDVVLSLSLFEETFGRTVLEAFYASCPVIAYSSGGIDELILKSGAGFVVERGDREGVINCLKLYLTSPGLLNEHAHKVTEFVEANFGSKLFSQKLMGIVNNYL